MKTKINRFAWVSVSAIGILSASIFFSGVSFAQDEAASQPPDPAKTLPQTFEVKKYLDIDFEAKCEEYESAGLSLPDECQRQGEGEEQGLSYFEKAEEKRISPVAQVIVDAIDLLAKLIGSVALLVFIAGALLTIISEGQEDRLQKGKQAMIYSLIGIVIAFSAYLIATFVQSFFY